MSKENTCCWQDPVFFISFLFESESELNLLAESVFRYLNKSVAYF